MFSNGVSTNLTTFFPNAYGGPTFNLNVSEAPGFGGNTTNSTGNGTFQVLPGPLAVFTAADNSVTATAGQVSTAIQLFANDSYGNIVTSFTGTQDLTPISNAVSSINGTNPTINGASFSSSVPVVFSDGVTVPGDILVDLFQSGPTTINFTQGPVGMGANVTVQVNPGPAVGFTEANVSSTQTNWIPYTGLVLVANDSYGNIATSYNGVQSILFSTNATSTTSVLSNNVNNVSFGNPTDIDFINGVSAPNNISIIIYDPGYWTINATDANSGISVIQNASFDFTGGAQEPQISSVSVGSIDDNDATINWNTDEASTSFVQFGVSSTSGVNTSATDSPASTDGVTSHAVTLSGLSIGTTYYYIAWSCDENGQCSGSPQGTFTTAGGQATTTAPETTTSTTASISTTTNATVTTTTTQNVSTTTASSPQTGGPDYGLIIIVVLVLIAIGFGVYFYFKNQKKGYYR
jgi:hypothetical protein